MIYGRRRIGKTSLILEALKEHDEKKIVFTAIPDEIIMRCDSDSGKKLIKSMVLRTADRQGMC